MTAAGHPHDPAGNPAFLVMLGQAEWLIEEHQYPAAILLAQGAVEIAAHDAFIGLIAQRIGTPVDDALLNLIPDRSFMDKRTRDFWTWLTGTKITEPSDVWKPYNEHVERRNRVAHAREWGDADWGAGARDSVAAARTFIERIGTDR